MPLFASKTQRQLRITHHSLFIHNFRDHGFAKSAQQQPEACQCLYPQSRNARGHVWRLVSIWQRALLRLLSALVLLQFERNTFLASAYDLRIKLRPGGCPEFRCCHTADLLGTMTPVHGVMSLQGIRMDLWKDGMEA